MFQAIENTWLGLDLKSRPDELISHGWWSLFRRWTATEAFHRNWPILRPEFSVEFARFVEERLGLNPAMPEVVPWYDHRIAEDERDSLIAEFDREWPKVTGDPKALEGTLRVSLREMIEAAHIMEGKVKEKAAWAILQGPKPRSDAEPKPSDCRGIVLIFEGPSLHPQERSEPMGRPDYELLVWVRRSHRGIGLGSYAMEWAIKRIEAGLQHAPLQVRYPRVADDAVRSMWKRFFSLYDFESEPNGPSKGDLSVCLRRLRPDVSGATPTA
jgi:hypothetical protein